MKMEKTPRYTQRERNMVLGFAAQYKEVIENKRTDAESNRKKDDVWRQIAKEFNARVYHQRSAKQLRQLYKNMKLLLKKDLCGEGKGNRSFMDLLNTLSQQESVAQYISEQMSPSGGAYSGRQQKYDDDDYDDSKTPFPQVGFDGMDPDVIVIKSEDISDNEQSQNGGGPDDMDDDDDDCLSPKDIPEVCLEEEDDEIFATDLRQSTPLSQPPSRSSYQQQQSQGRNQDTPPQPEVTIQNVGGIRVGSIGSLANLKALQNGNNSALSITHATNNGSSNPNNNNNSGSGSGSNGNNHNHSAGSGNNNNSTPNNHNSSANHHRRTSAEQAQQQLLLNNLGLSAVHQLPESALSSMPTLQRGSHNSNNNSSNNNPAANSTRENSFTNQLLLSLSANANAFGGHKGANATHHRDGHGNHGNTHSRSSDYLRTLEIEERKRKIDLLDAQIEYWKTLTKKLDANATHNPMPTCACHFPGKINGLQTPASSS